MTKLFVGALALAGAISIGAPAQAAPAQDGIRNSAVQLDLSAKKKKKHTRVVVRTYEAPRYYGYYGPTYYERPYVRPAPVWFGVGGWW